MQVFRGAVYGAILATVLCFPLSFAQAWEADVHYGLTLWLAKQAGFPDEQAKWIADGNQGVDNSSVTDPVHSTIASACTARDVTGSSEVHDHHFPSKNGVPDAPVSRVVKPGFVQRQGSVHAAPPLSDKQSSFYDFGKYLHALQDTWSHQGVPDFPDLCDQQLGWGHSFSRGGWACHLADLTYRWPNDALQTAKATYDAMVAQASSARPWSDLVPELSGFIAAQSKWQKDSWFSARGFGPQERGFLQEISLPDCVLDAQCLGPYPFQQLIEKWRTIASLRSGFARFTFGGRTLTVSVAGDIPADIRQLFVDFVGGLVAGGKSVKTDAIDTVLSRIALARALHISDACPNLVNELEDVQVTPDAVSSGLVAYQPLELCEAAFEAARAGEGVISCDAAAAALRNIRTPRRRGPDLRELAPVAQAEQLPLFVFEGLTSFNQRSESYSTVVRFIHLPRDALLLTARRVSGVAKIVAAVWMPGE